MPNHDALIVNYAAYESGTEFLGMTTAELPSVEFMSEKISGAGIGGEFEEILIGMISSMTTKLNFRTVTNRAVILLEPKEHSITLRVAQDRVNTKNGNAVILPVKHVLKLIPKKTSFGKVGVATVADVSGEYITKYYAVYIDGKKVTEIDPANFICTIEGSNYLSKVNSVLGLNKKKKNSTKKKTTKKKKKKK